MTYDVLIIGAGPAGLNAALTLGRSRRTVVVVDAGNPRNAPASHMHGFLSRDGMPPSEFLALARKEVEGYGVDIIQASVTTIHKGFKAELSTGDIIAARRVIVATGVTDLLPDIPGIKESWGQDVIACPYCHGYEVRDEPLAVIGSAEHALLVRQWSKDLIFFPHTTPLDDPAELTARDIRIVPGEITRVVRENGRVKGVEVDDRVYPRTAVFVRPPFRANNDILVQLGADLTEAGVPVVDPTGKTSVPGVWAAGNIVTPFLQVIASAGAGSMAGAMVNHDLLTEPFSAEMERHAHLRRSVVA
ncbi:NAD(P)/FAD-dependent oxidoreductase [Actinocrispum sp. NPDC049592]|uniref:NAD(P)/FAD-dependent oxidoreductase n=1 Tax=Actinocrispum sp. NPDC049592 TaxID=3154835 RepID=UPI003421D3F7